MVLHTLCCNDWWACYIKVKSGQSLSSRGNLNKKWVSFFWYGGVGYKFQGLGASNPGEQLIKQKLNQCQR